MFLIMLDFEVGLYFCDFGLYLEFNIFLDCIEVYLDFN